MASTDSWIGCLSFNALQNDMKATDDELTYLHELINLRSRKRKAQLPREAGYVSPTMVIDNFLYHGELKHANNKDLLGQLNIRHIINISDCELNQEIHDGFNVVWINLDDDFTADITQHFDRTNEFIHSCRTKGEKVLVHCQMGISRSSSIVLAYLLKHEFDSLSKAYDYLVERRRFAAPNHSFFLQLIRYEHRLREQK